MSERPDGDSAPGDSEAQGARPVRTVRVGVTGHRTLPDDPALSACVGAVLVRIRALVAQSVGGPVRITVLSPLAEGADRLVVTAAFAAGNTTLHAILPLPPEDFTADFATEPSRMAFHALLSRATRVVILPPAPTREVAYRASGEYVVDHCDALIALWDGLPARGNGGTGEVVTYARERQVPLFWITPTAPYRVVEEAGRGLRHRED